MKDRYTRSGLLMAFTCALASSASAGNQSYNYDARGRVTGACTALPGSGQLSSYAEDSADNRQAYLSQKTDIALYANSGIYSPSGNYMLWMQPDNNLVAYENSGSGWMPLGWATNTVGTGATEAYFQSDGNLVLYTSSGTSVWSSGTAGNYCASIAVQNNGNITITSVSGAIVWQTGTGS